MKQHLPFSNGLQMASRRKVHLINLHHQHQWDPSEPKRWATLARTSSKNRLSVLTPRTESVQVHGGPPARGWPQESRGQDFWRNYGRAENVLFD